MPTLSDYGKMLVGKRCTCRREPSFAGLQIVHYDHVGGWKVDGIANRQWLTVVCPSCGYERSLTKLNIPGKATSEEQAEEEIRIYGYSKSARIAQYGKQVGPFIRVK